MEIIVFCFVDEEVEALEQTEVEAFDSKSAVAVTSGGHNLSPKDWMD